MLDALEKDALREGGSFRSTEILRCAFRFRFEDKNGGSGGAALDRVSSIISQIVHLVPRPESASLVGEHRAEWQARGLSVEAPFSAMLSGKLGDASRCVRSSRALRPPNSNVCHPGLDGALCHAKLASTRIALVSFSMRTLLASCMAAASLAEVV